MCSTWMNSLWMIQPPNPLMRCWQDEEVEAKSTGITASSWGDVIHERRKSTTEFTLAPGWRADYILYSNVMTQATCSGGKIGWGKPFQKELNGIMRNQSMPMWCHAGSGSWSALQAFFGGCYVICTFCAFCLYFPPCVVHPSLCISSCSVPKAMAKMCLKIIF